MKIKFILLLALLILPMQLLFAQGSGDAATGGDVSDSSGGSGDQDACLPPDCMVTDTSGGSGTSGSGSGSDPIPGGGGDLIGIALLLTVILIALAYMVGTATNNAHALVFAKDELFHLSITIVILISIWGILELSELALNGFLNFSLSTLLGGTSDCFDGTQSATVIARCYIAGLEGKARNILASTIRESINKEIASATNFGFYNPVSGGIMTPLDGELKTHSMQFDLVAMTFVLPALISISLQRIFLDFGIDFVRFLLPVAMIFRVLPVFRQMGNLLIAVSIALWIFIPSMYAINAAMNEVVFESAELGCRPGSATEELIEDKVLGGCSEPYNFWAIASLLPQAYFLPNLTIAITITFLSGINKALKVLT